MQDSLFPITSEYKEVPVTDLPDFPTINPTAQMVNSVKKYGVLEPVLLRGKTLVAGRRRLKAAKMAGLKTVPARIFPEDFSNEYILSLVENEQRRPNALSDLHSIEALMRQGKDEDAITAETGISAQRIRKILSIKKLLPILRRALEDGVIKYSVAQAAAKKSVKVQERLVDILAQEGVLRLKDVQKVAKVEKKEKVAALPDSLFGAIVPTWKPDTLINLQSARNYAKDDADPDWLDALDELIKDLQE
jgi:ParB/RepB/Spo0J family partition protein